MKVSRVFLSSTFRDFHWEREFLNREVVPEINRELAPAGRQVDLLDLRWGVSRDAGLDNHAVDICLSEIRRSHASGASPFFLYLGSSRSGWMPLPRVLPEADYQFLKKAVASESDEDRELLERLYIVDRNFLEPSRALRNREEFQASTDIDWEEAENTVRLAVLARENELPEHLGASFCTPITVQELHAGLELVGHEIARIAALWRDDRQTIFCRLVAKRKQEGDGFDFDRRNQIETLFDRAGVPLTHLTRTGKKDAAYREAFAEWARAALMRAANAPSLDRVPAEPNLRQTSSLIERACISETLETIRSNPEKPILIFGSSGCGKSVLVDQIEQRSSDTLIIRPGRQGQRLDAESFGLLLQSRLELEPSAPDARGHILETLRHHLGAPFDGERLVIIDGIDECDWRDAGEAVSWIPVMSGRGVTLAVTTSSDSIREAFVDVFGEDRLLVLPEFDEAEAREAIRTFLEVSGRQVQPEQLETMIAGLGEMPGKAVATRIAATIGGSVAHDVSLPVCNSTLSEWVATWMVHLEQQEGHGRALIEILLALLAASRRSVPEPILFEAVRYDRQAVSWLQSAFPDAIDLEEFPRTAFSRAMGSIAPMLEEREVEGELHFSFVHAALKRSLVEHLSEIRLKRAHAKLLYVYEKRWSALAETRETQSHLLSELIFQGAIIGEAARASLEGLVTDPGFAARKIDPSTIGDTLVELEELAKREWLGSPILRQYCRMIAEERHNFAHLKSQAEREAYLRQRVQQDFQSNPLRASYVSDEGGPTQLLLPSPRVPGIHIADIVPSKFRSHMVTVGDDIVIGQNDGSIAVISAAHGTLRGTLQGHTGLRGIAKAPGSNRIVAWGSDGQLSISSVSAVRELNRFDFDGKAGRVVLPMRSGNILALAGDPLEMFVLSDNCSIISKRPFDLRDAPSFRINNEGLSEEFPLKSEVFATGLFGQGQANTFGYRSDIVELADGYVAVQGMMGFALWSTKAEKLVLSVSQVREQEWSPHYLLPKEDGVVVISKSGGIALLRPDATTVVISPAPEVGGIEKLDEDSFLRFRITGDSEIAVSLLGTDGLLGDERRISINASKQGFFRDSRSSMARGILPMGKYVFAWCAEGHYRVDMERVAASWSPSASLELTLQPGPRLAADAAVLFHNGRAQFHLVNGEKLDVGHLLDEVETCTDLGEGRALLTLRDERCILWNAAETLEWAMGDSDAALIASERFTGKAALLADGRMLRKYDRVDTRRIEFEIVMARHGEPDGAGTIVSVSQHSSERSVFGLLGTVVVSAGGNPATILVADGAHEYLRKTVNGVNGIDVLVLSNTDALAMRAPHVAFLASSKKAFLSCWIDGTISVGHECHSDIVRIIVHDGCVLLISLHGIELLQPVDSLWSVFESATLVNQSDLASDGQKGRIGATAWFEKRGYGFAVVSHFNPKQNRWRRRKLLFAFSIGGGFVAKAMIESISEIAPSPDGFIFVDEAGIVQSVRLNEDSNSLVFAPVSDAIELPLPLQSSMEPVHGPSYGGDRWWIEILPGVTFHINGSEARATLEPDRITVEADGKLQSFFYPSGYRLLDAVEDGSSLTILVSAEGLLQMVRFDAAKTVGKSHEVTVRGPQRRALRRLGLGDGVNFFLPDPKDLSVTPLGENPKRLRARELMEMIESNALLGDVETAQEQLSQLDELTSLNDTGEVDDTFKNEAHRLAALVTIKEGSLDFGRFATQRALLTRESDVAVLAPIWIDALITLMLTFEKFADTLTNRRDTVEESLSKTGYDLPTCCHWASVNSLLEKSYKARTSKNKEAGTVSNGHSGNNTQSGSSDLNAMFKTAVTLDERGASTDAEQIFKNAADAGHAQSAFSLAQMHRHGRAVQPSMKEAREYMAIAARGGVHYAFNNLATMMMRGEGGPEDYPGAIEWAERGYASGDEVAGINLAIALATNPQRKEKDKIMALEILRDLATKGNQNASALLKKLQATPGKANDTERTHYRYPGQRRTVKEVDEIVVSLVSSFIKRYTEEENLNVDLLAMAVGLSSGRLARMAGVADPADVVCLVASAAPQELQDSEEWCWPEELPIEEEIFAAETAALGQDEEKAIQKMRERNIEPIHLAISIGIYATHLAEQARENVDPETVMGVFKTSFEKGYAGFSER